MLRQRNRLNGFTAIELMTVVVIIGVIAAIGVANYASASKKRALEASLLSNIRIMQIMLETYKVDYQKYPENLSELSIAADAGKYNKSVANPYTKQSSFVNTSSAWVIDFVYPTDASFNKDNYAGKVGYQSIAEPTLSKNFVKYYLFGYDGDGKLIQRKGNDYFVTNG